MQFFTPRFTKDLISLLFFSVFIYAIPNNPITHPRIQPTQAWQIEVIQKPFVLGFAGHNYLVLRDNNNKIIRELHGLATDRTTGEWQYIGINPNDMLKVWEFPVARYGDQESSLFSGRILATGDETYIKNIWDKGLECKTQINAKNISYPPYGVNLRGTTENSNSVAYTLSKCMGIDIKHLGIFTPGSATDLLEN